MRLVHPAVTLALVCVAGLTVLTRGQNAQTTTPPAQAAAAPAPLRADAPFTVAVATAVVEAAPVYMVAEGPFGKSMQYINGGVRTLSNNGAHAAGNATTQMLVVIRDNPKVRLLFTLTEGLYRIVAKRSSGINTLADLKGKRVSTGSPGSATEVMAFRVIEAAGLDKDKDMKRERLGVSESVNAVKDRKIDAFFWVGGIPTAAVTDLAATPGMKMKLIDHSDTAEKMNAKYGKLYTASTIKAGSYPGQDKDNAITEVWNLIVTGGKMSNEDAYTIVKTLVEKKEDIVAVHKEALSFSIDNQVQDRSPIPFHPGALKYFKEKGVGG